MIDSLDRNHKLALLSELNVGKGKLLICSIDLPNLQQHPEARQFLKSIYSYMQSDAFSPQESLQAEDIQTILSGQ